MASVAILAKNKSRVDTERKARGPHVLVAYEYRIDGIDLGFWLRRFDVAYVVVKSFRDKLVVEGQWRKEV